MELIDCPDLSSVFDLDVGYHGVSWVDLYEVGFGTDWMPEPLIRFVGTAVPYARERGLPAGCCYVRIVDAGQPENYMSWHTDNHDGGLRFATSISTDGVPVNLAWPEQPGWEGVTVTDTAWGDAWQAPNGQVVMFTTELHGVLPQEPRPGERTANFFVTFYERRELADLHTTNNTATSEHQALPALSTTVS